MCRFADSSRQAVPRDVADEVAKAGESIARAYSDHGHLFVNGNMLYMHLLKRQRCEDQIRNDDPNVAMLRPKPDLHPPTDHPASVSSRIIRLQAVAAGRRYITSWTVWFPGEARVETVFRLPLFPPPSAKRVERSIAPKVGQARKPQAATAPLESPRLIINKPSYHLD